MLTRFVELQGPVSQDQMAGNEVYLHRSEPTMKMFELTARYFPLPHPTSKPTEPSGRLVKKLSILGHGCMIVRLVRFTYKTS